MGFRDRQHVRRPSRLELPAWFPTALMVVFVIGVMGLGYFTFTKVKEFVAGSEIAVMAPPDADPNQAGQPEGEGNQAAMPAGWTEGRVTVLLMGIDERQLEHGPWRTDTMILLTVDPVSQTAGMISFPRDLWVEIPNYGGLYDRINTAHFRGDADNYPGGGGPALAMETVRHNFGVPVDYYASVNFYAFIQIIDRLNCVPITVPETIDDPTYPAAEGYGYDPFHMEAGEHCMGGETLLKYARTRATFGSDFDRAARQQQVILAIRDHVLADPNTLPTLISQAGDIYSDVEAGLSTNLSMEQMIALAQMAAEIPEENICKAVISGPYVESLETLPDGSEVIIWDRDAVRQLIADVFSGTGVCEPGAEDLAGAAQAEQAAVSIVNGTEREGLATETGERLTAAGLTVVSVGNADRFYDQSIIYNYTGKDATARYLAMLLNLPETAIVVAEPTTALYDIQIVLGADYASP